MLDANVFIGAHRNYYSLDFCPGFWDCVIRHFHDGRLLSIDKVRDEIYNTGKPQKPDALLTWTKAAPRDLFVSSSDQPVMDAYRDLINWIQNNHQYKREAKDEFASVADGWLAAYAKAHNAIVVTHEVLAPDAKKRVPLPNVCRQFNVPYLNTFEMLRHLGVQFDLRST